MMFVKILFWVNFVISALFVICYAYQAVYLVFSLFKKPKIFPKGKPHRYAVLIAARNEEAVIGQLIESIKAQTYPKELVDIFVVADNCTDQTAETARIAGATVFERENKVQTGKGHALCYLLENIRDTYCEDIFDGFFVFDADNILDAHFIEEMNNVFDAGYEIVTSYRNSKNFGDNWISIGYGLFFLREATQLNRPRMMLNTSACVSGTGFLFSNAIAKRNHGWKHFLLTEDFEFTVDCVLHGQKVGYCESAMIYDEQPTELGASFLQRARWIRGYLQVFSRYGTQMLKQMLFTRSFSCFDMIMNNIPCLVLTCLTLLSNIAMFVMCAISPARDMANCLISLSTGLLLASCTLWFVGGLTCITQRRYIHASKGKLILGVLTFPVFVFTFAISMLTAIFGRVEWKPIKHSVTLSAKDLRNMHRS